MTRNGRHAPALVLFWVFCLTLALAQSDDTALVDYRLTPMEQVKKVAAQTPGEGPTMTVMNLRSDFDADFQHMILSEPTATPANLEGQLDVFDSVSWRPPSEIESSACSSQGLCETKTNDMCAAAGHLGVWTHTVKIVVHIDGSKTCSGNCKSGGAVAFVTCGNGGLKACWACD